MKARARERALADAEQANGESTDDAGVPPMKRSKSKDGDSEAASSEDSQAQDAGNARNGHSLAGMPRTASYGSVDSAESLLGMNK